MKKKCLLIFVGIILVLVVAGAIVLPKRIELYNAINDNIESLGVEGKMYFYVDVFSPDNLNKSCLVLIRVEDRQQAYAMINSIKIK